MQISQKFSEVGTITINISQIVTWKLELKNFYQGLTRIKLLKKYLNSVGLTPENMLLDTVENSQVYIHREKGSLSQFLNQIQYLTLTYY